MSAIDIADKRAFLKWFLNHYRFKRREAHWILTYISEREEVLKNVRFVDSLAGVDRGIMLTTLCYMKDIPFFTYITTLDGEQGLLITDVESAFSDIRMRPDETLYVQLNFRNRSSCHQWYRVMEDNPNEDMDLPEDLLLSADSLIYNLEFNYRLSRVDEMIEKALREGDRKSFMEATALRNTMLRVKPKVMYETVKN